MKYDSVNKMIESFSEEDKLLKAKYPIIYNLKKFYYFIIRKIEDIKYIPNSIKYFYQRGRYNISDYDWWSLDSYLADIIVKGVTKLRTQSHGFPYSIEKGTEEENINNWHNILDNILYTFKTCKSIIEGDVYYLSSKEYTEERFDIYTRMVQETSGRLLNREETEKFEKGFDLFKEYFFNLWD